MQNSPPPTSEQAIDAALNGLGTPPFSVVASEFTLPVKGPDATATLAWSGQTQRFVIVYNGTGTPKQIAAAETEVLAYTALTPGTSPMLVAPFLPTEQIERLVAKGISAVDLSGNFGIVVPTRWLVMRTGNKNQYPSSAPIKNVFRGISSLVPRALITRRTFRSSTEIRQDIASVTSITAPTISKVLTSLSEALLVAKNGSIRVLQPDKLLTELSANYEAIRSSRRVMAKLSMDDLTTVAAARSLAQPDLLYAVDGADLYTVMPSSNPVKKIYTTSIATLTAGLQLETESRFPNVELIEWSAPAIYYDRRVVDGLFRTSPLQVYLELSTGGARDRSVAETLRETLIARPVSGAA